MRNLKRALSLAMASVMTLGMMTVGASAKGLNFSDAAEITNVEAATITSDLGIFVGYETADGKFEFQGDKVVTRAEMAVVCAKLLYGADVDPAQFAGTNTFTDVPAWAEGWVNLCASLGIIAGRGNGIFDPNAPVSTVEAASMLTKTLGYFQNAKDYGNDWKLAVTAKATQLGLYGDLKLAVDAGLTRDSVAELVFNTLTKAVPVDYNELLGVYYNQNQGIVYALEFNYLQTLGYKNFDLVYKTVQEGDIYGRPTTLWGTGHYKYDKDTVNNASGSLGTNLDSNGGLISGNVQILEKNEIIKVAETADYTYTENTTNEDVANDLGAKVLGMSWKYYVDGVEYSHGDTLPNGSVVRKPAYLTSGKIDWTRTDKDERYELTNKGSVLEIYVDEYANNGAGQVVVCQYNYYLGEVQNVKSDDNGDYVNVKALSKEGKKLENKKFYTNELEKGDLVVFTIDENDDDELYIAEMFTPGTVTGEVTRVEKEKASEDTYIRLNGETTKYYYTSKDHNVYDVNGEDKNHPELKEDYILYTTPTNYVLGFELAEETETKYLYVKDSDEELSDWVAKVILSDASTVKVDVKKKYKDGKDEKDIDWLTSDKYLGKNVANIDEDIWKYSVNDSGVYTLTKVVSKDLDDVSINNGKSYINLVGDSDKEILIDEDTIFVDTMNGKSYVGYSAVPNVENADIEYVLDKNEIADIVYILDGDIYDKDSTYFVLAKDEHDSLKYDGDWYREYFAAYVNGDKETLMVEYDAWNNGGYNDNQLIPGVLYKAVKTIDEEYITEVQTVQAKNGYEGTLYSVGNNAFKLDSQNNQVKFDTDADTKFVIVEAIYNNDGEVTKYAITDADISDLKEIKVDCEDAAAIDEDNDGNKLNDKDDFIYTVKVIEETKNTAELVYVFVEKAVAADEAKVVLNTDGGVEKVDVKATTLQTGKSVTVVLTGGYDTVAKSTGLFQKGYTYTVMINGQACTGIGIGNNQCVVTYTIAASDIVITKTDDKQLVLKIGTVAFEEKVAQLAATDKVLTDAEAAAGTANFGKVENEFAEDVDERVIITLDAKYGTADTGYMLTYTNDLDTAVYTFQKQADKGAYTFVIGMTAEQAKKDWAVQVKTYDDDITSVAVDKVTLDKDKATLTVDAIVEFAKAKDAE